MRYDVFGKTGLRVSEIALGTGTFGTGWGHGADAGESGRIFDAYAEAGGNFIDTADSYQFGQSEELLGGFLRGRRENFVLASKYTSGASPNADRLVTGHSRKAMVALVEASLKRLRTDRIDIYWAHHPDALTPSAVPRMASRGLAGRGGGRPRSDAPSPEPRNRAPPGQWPMTRRRCGRLNLQPRRTNSTRRKEPIRWPTIMLPLPSRFAGASWNGPTPPSLRVPGTVSTASASCGS